MKKPIGNVGVNLKEYNINNFKEITDVIRNVYVRDNGFCDGYGYEKTNVKGNK